ncbi:uncharacterized protein LOC131307156 [Rhododendron vialii]|uniref:uncharacterized protein LOC131307156 n=1 Tax=Rhododendron vialii TaxID=182163 RepID=UPI00265F0DE4|nr:uncharacterized protein LOC131307156 [Rhododendron vialii]
MTQFRYLPHNQQGFDPSFFGPPPSINHSPRHKQTDEMIKALMQSQISFIEQNKQTIVNAACIHYVGYSSGPSNLNPSLEEAKAITTLRSGKVIDKDLPPKQKLVLTPAPVATPAIVSDLGSVPEDEKEAESPEVVVPAHAAPTTPMPSLALYPNHLVARPKANRTKSQDKVLLTEQVSSILRADILIKSKDLGCPTFPIAIASQEFDKALLDLGTTVNLLPYSVYLKLGLGDLRATPVTLQLADRSVRIPNGLVEDVLIQVGEFFFPVDFIVLDICPIPEVFEKTSSSLAVLS